MRRYRVFRPLDDPRYVKIDLDFDSLSDAEAFLGALQVLWGSGRAAPGACRSSADATCRGGAERGVLIGPSARAGREEGQSRREQREPERAAHDSARPCQIEAPRLPGAGDRF